MKKSENSKELGRFGHFVGRLLWICMILAAIALVVLAVWGLCAMAAALDRGKAWAEWAACVLFLIAFALVLHEMNK